MTVLSRKTMYKCPDCGMLHQSEDNAALCCVSVKQVKGVGCPVCGAACESIAEICCTPAKIRATIEWCKNAELGAGHIVHEERRLAHAELIDWDHLTIGEN